MDGRISPPISLLSYSRASDLRAGEFQGEINQISVQHGKQRLLKADVFGASQTISEKAGSTLPIYKRLINTDGFKPDRLCSQKALQWSEAQHTPIKGTEHNDIIKDSNLSGIIKT